MKKLAAILFLLMYNGSQAMGSSGLDNATNTSDEVNVFKLFLGMAFQGTVTFYLIKKNDSYSLFLKQELKHFIRPENMPEQKRIALTRAQARELIEKLDNALHYNPLDTTDGEDGSQWCLESRRGLTYTKACFWSPGANSAERGLVGLNELGHHLWRLSGLEQAGIELF